MSEWKEYKLGEIAEIIPGFAFKSKEFGKIGELVIKIKDINPPYIILSAMERVDTSSYPKDKLGKYKLAKGDFVVAMTGATIGKVGKLKTDVLAYINQRVAKIKAKNCVCNDFIYYSISTEQFQAFIRNNIDSHTAQENISAISIGKFPILLPPLPEQKAIAAILSSLDDKIDLLHRQNATLEKMAETLFRQWFIEEAKEEWECYKLKDLVKHVKPGTNFQPKRIEYGIPFLNVRNLNNGFIDLSDTTKISKEEYQRVHKNWEPEENDILISRIGTLGIVAVIQGSDLPVAVHYNMINLKAKTISYQFLYFLLKSQLFKEKYFSNVRQSVQEYVTIEDTENVEISLPIGTDLFKEHEIAFNELFNKIKSNQTQIRTLTALRDTLLPKLMSGEIRVL